MRFIIQLLVSAPSNLVGTQNNGPTCIYCVCMCVYMCMCSPFPPSLPTLAPLHPTQSTSTCILPVPGGLSGGGVSSRVLPRCRSVPAGRKLVPNLPGLTTGQKCDTTCTICTCASIIVINMYVNTCILKLKFMHTAFSIKLKWEIECIHMYMYMYLV